MRYGQYFDTQIGKLYIAEEDGYLVELGSGEAQARDILETTQLLEQTKQQLQEYFAGNRCEFVLPICGKGTDFQKKVWKALCEIPYGETRTYGEIAAMIGNPKASRAVGVACNKNPIIIVVPCHRVIGGNGRLVGFGGGLAMKEQLLKMEDIL